MPLNLSTDLEQRLEDAAREGLDANWVVQIYWPEPVGTRYFAWRPVTIDGNVYLPKLRSVPQCGKAIDLKTSRPEAMNDGVEIVLLNTIEDTRGEIDTARIQDLMGEAPLGGVLVKVGFCDLQVLSGGEADVKWDGLYRVDRIQRNSQELRLGCVDALLQGGERTVGEEITDSDWPKAPPESYGQVRGPVFGKVEDLPLVPVEVGLSATLSGEIDDRDTTIYVSGELGLWETSGYVEIQDEIVRYQGIDRDGDDKALLNCTRGTGFPTTTPASHANGALVRGAYSGREALLVGAITASSTTITINAPLVLGSIGWPDPEVLLIDNEAIAVGLAGGQTFYNVQRGVPVPTLARIHDAGTAVRTIPVGPNGLPRYRYLAGAGEVSAVTDLRVVDGDGGDAQPYTGGAAVVSEVTAPSGKVMAVVDVPARPRVEKFGGSANVPSEFILETANLGVSPIPANAWLRWRSGPEMGSALASQITKVLDPSTSAEAAILTSAAASNILDLIFNAKWDSGLNAPRRRYGRFKDARVRLRYQYDRNVTNLAHYGTYNVRKNGAGWRAGTLSPPLGSTGGGNGSITGTQTLPKTRWGSQTQRRTVSFASNLTNQYADGLTGQWINPFKTAPSNVIAGGQVPNHSDAFDGDARTFLNGYWNFSSQAPATAFGARVGNLWLDSRDTFPEATSLDKITKLVLTAKNPVWPEANGGAGVGAYWTGADIQVTTYDRPLDNPNAAATQTWNYRLPAIAVDRQPLAVPAGWNWSKVQGVRVVVFQTIQIGPTTRGATIGDIGLEIEYLPVIEGQTVDTNVEGSFFSVSGGAGTAPTAIYEQVISLGNSAKQWARQNNADPWDFFSQAAPQGSLGGLQIRVALPSVAGALQMAIGDVILEMEYEPLEVTFDGELIANVDGRTGAPLSGGAPVVLQNAADLLAYLVDQEEFYGLSTYRDEASYLAVRTLVDEWKLARAITEKTTLRDLVADLCADSRLLQLFDAGVLYCRHRTLDAPATESVGTVGEQADVARRLVNETYTIVSRMEDVFNSLGCYYRFNYLTNDYRGVVEANDRVSQATAVGKRRDTPNLKWHQSARGYAGGIAGQRTAVQNLANFMVRLTSRVYDYAQIELSAAAAEGLQRYDALMLEDSRNGYYGAIGRVMQTSRVSPTKWSVVLQLPSATNGYYWQALSPEGVPVPGTYVRIGQSGTLMQFVVGGLVVMELDTSGGLTCPWNLIQSDEEYHGLPSDPDTGLEGTTLPFIFRSNEAADVVYVYRQRLSGDLAGQLERVLTLTQDGDVSLHPCWDDGEGAGVERSFRTPAELVGSGANGVTDTGAGLVTGVLRFSLGNELVAEIGDERMDVAEILTSRD